MGDGDGDVEYAFEDRDMEFEGAGLDDVRDAEMADYTDAETAGHGVLEGEETTRQLAAGLASQNEGEVLAALAAMQKAITGAEGEKVLVSYVLASPQCAEIMGAWGSGPGAATAVPVLLLLYYMFRHPLGNIGTRTNTIMTVKSRLDKIARSIVRNRMKDIYSHLSSSQKSRQNVALLLLSAIVLRGRALAIEIATSFDFTLEALRKLGHPPKQQQQQQNVANKIARKGDGDRGILKQATRVAFVELAMSFLSVGDPGLLRWVLQKRPLWTGVLHGLAKDDERTIVRVLILLQKKVMVPESLVPRGLQSVLFGDATLEQLARISSDNSLGVAGEVARATLLSLCTDPSHGLCPENSSIWDAVTATSVATGSSNSSTCTRIGKSGGGQGRLLRLLLRLKVTEVNHHRDLLLAVARTRPILAALYLASIPLSLEPRVSSAWFNAISLVSQLIPIASQPPSISSLAAQGLGPPTRDDPVIQTMLQSLLPSSLSRGVLNRGLLHVDFMVKHACLRVLLEALLCLKRLSDSLDAAWSTEPKANFSSKAAQGQSESINDCIAVKPRLEEDSLQEQWMKLSQSIQDIMRASLPDPNTLLATLSALRGPLKSSVKAASSTPGKPHDQSPTKKRKRKEASIAGNGSHHVHELSDRYEYDAVISQLWGSGILDETSQGEGIEELLHAKVVQVLAAYQAALPVAMADTGFDAFRLLPDDPATLSVAQQRSLSALLLAITGYTTASADESLGPGKGITGLGSAYKRFRQLLMFMLTSDVEQVSGDVRLIVHRVIVSSGAFDGNLREISMWINPLVQWKIENSSGSSLGGETMINLARSHGPLPGTLCSRVVEFLSEAVSGIGQNIYKYLDLMHSILSKYTLREAANVQVDLLEGIDVPEFGPFAVCALENCIQLVLSKKKLPAERIAVAVYVANVLELLLRYQRNPQPLAVVISSLLSKWCEVPPKEQLESSEWAILLDLFQCAQSVILSDANDSRIFTRGLRKSIGVTRQVYKDGQLADMLKAFQEDQTTTIDAKISDLATCVVCASVQELVDSFPLLLRFSLQVLEGDFSIVLQLLTIHPDVLYEVSLAWPEMFTEAAEEAAAVDKDRIEEFKWTEKQKQFKSWNVELGSTSLKHPDTFALFVLLLVTPFPVLFTSSTYCKDGQCLPSETFLTLLQTSLRRVHPRDWVCMLRVIVSGMKDIIRVVLSSEGVINIEPLIRTCFSLIRTLILQFQQLPLDRGSSPSFSRDLELMIVDLLHQPGFYNLFLSLVPSSVLKCSDPNLAIRDAKSNMLCDEPLKRVLTAAATTVNIVDSHILSLLVDVLGPTKAVAVEVSDQATVVRKRLLRACRPYFLKAVSRFQSAVDESSTRGMAPSAALFAIYTLIPYIQPSSLLSGIFMSLLSGKIVEVKRSKHIASPHVLGLHFATIFLESRASPDLTDTKDESEAGDLEGDLETGVDESPSIHELYERVVHHVTGNPSIMADLCLLSFLQAPKLKQHVQAKVPGLGFEQLLSRGTFKVSSGLQHSTPLEVLKHCVCHPNRVTGKIAMILAEASTVHMAELGRLLALGTADRRRRPGALSSSMTVHFAETLLTQNPNPEIRKMEVVLTDESLLSLLPAAFIYVASASKKTEVEGGRDRVTAIHVASVYAKLLIKQLKNWDRFAAVGDVIDSVSPVRQANEEEHFDYVKSVLYYSNSPLGQVVSMLQTCLLLHPLSTKVRTKLLQGLLPQDGLPLLGENMSSLLSLGEEDVRRCTFEAVAKADIIRHFLSASCRSQENENRTASESESDKLKQQNPTDDAAGQKDAVTHMKFLHSLLSTLGTRYKSNSIDRSSDALVTTMGGSFCSHGRRRADWLQLLEEFLLLNVIDIAKQVAHMSFDTSQYLHLYKYSMTLLLGYRYGKVLAMKACRYLTFVTFQGLQRQPAVAAVETDGDVDALGLVIGHSKFLSTLLVADSKRTNISRISGKHAGKGTALNSLSSVLSLVGAPPIDTLSKDRNSSSKQAIKSVETSQPPKRIVASDTGEGEGFKPSTLRQDQQDEADDAASNNLSRLEIVKLLKILLAVRLKPVSLHGSTVQSVPLDEVLSILLAAYGATVSAVDQEIYLLMQEIESYGGLGFSGLSELDYLWGEAALKRRQSKAEATTNSVDRPDNTDELRKQTFKEYLLIDPRRCGLAVLYFPMKRQFGELAVGQLELTSEYSASYEEYSVRSSSDAAGDLSEAAYDPAFILPFALQGLSTGCISAEEFVKLGLLSLAFASMSSAQESMRKAGYEILAKYYSVLEDAPTFKGRLQIRLLMTHVKNAVTEPWQRLPAVFTVFAAEASCILMHPENHQYTTLNQLLLRAPSMDLENIPLFQVMFGSGSVHYRSDCLWILRLLAGGLRSALDARVYRRRFVLELLMSFHDTTMTDRFSRKWILQVLYQAAGVRSCAQYLVEHTGLLSWLAFVAVSDAQGGLAIQGDTDCGDIASICLQIIERLMRWVSIQRHFLVDCLEELSKAGHLLHRFLVGASKPQHLAIFRRSALHLMLTLTRLSHKRRKHQTRFTLNLEGLLEVLHWVGREGLPQAGRPSKSYIEDTGTALQLLLHTSPPAIYSAQDKSALLAMMGWALSTASQLETGVADISPAVRFDRHPKGKAVMSEALYEKLLRWFAAAVILGEVAGRARETGGRDEFNTCLPFSHCSKRDSTERGTSSVEVNKKLANLLLILEARVSEGAKCALLVSVVAALGLLTWCLRTSTDAGEGDVQVAQQNIQCALNLLLSELPAPEVANPFWQWSFNSPWSTDTADVQSTDELAAQEDYVAEICRTVIILSQQLLSRPPSQYTSLLSHWEVVLLHSHQTDYDSDGDPIRKVVVAKLRSLQLKLSDAFVRIPGPSSDALLQNKE